MSSPLKHTQIYEIAVLILIVEILFVILPIVLKVNAFVVSLRITGCALPWDSMTGLLSGLWCLV